MSSEITVTEHLLLQQQRAPQATGHFTALFHDLVLSAKIIARSVNKAGLLDVLGGTGDINVRVRMSRSLTILPTGFFCTGWSVPVCCAP